MRLDSSINGPFCCITYDEILKTWEMTVLQSKPVVGMLSFISLIVGLIFLSLFIFTGNSFIDDDITMPLGFILLPLSFVLSLFSRKDKFGRVSLYVFPIIAGIYLLFFGVMSLLWKP